MGKTGEIIEWWNPDLIRIVASLELGNESGRYRGWGTLTLTSRIGPCS